MNTDTAIEWTDATWNPIGGCSIESPGCMNCYAMRLAGTRLHKLAPYAGTTKQVNGKTVWNGMLTALPDDHKAWGDPVRWRGATHPKLGAGMPSLIFAADMCDLAHRQRSFDIIDRVVSGLIYSRHIGQLLTKRADVLASYVNGLIVSGRWLYFDHPLFKKPNFDLNAATVESDLVSKLWLGISAERPEELGPRWRHMRRFAEAGWQTFISMEPLLERMHFCNLLSVLSVKKKPMIIVGGENAGRGSRRCSVEAVREIRDACAEFGAPFFFKGWGFCQPNPTFYPECADRLLDGKVYGEFPQVAA